MAQAPSKHLRLRRSEELYYVILERIFSGKLRAGDVVAEKTLAAELGVSRTPIHEAVRELVRDGFLKQELNQRPIVTGFSPQDIYEIFEMRALLEGEAAFYAAEKIDRPRLNRLSEMASVLREGEPDQAWLKLWTEFDEVFHQDIAGCCGNGRLAADINRHRLSHRILNLNIEDLSLVRQALEEHIAILEALSARDGETARKEMRRHIKEWQAYFVAHSPTSA